jgi:hypothetical protein
MAVKIITWTRSDTYVQESSKGGMYYARCGIIDIAGHYWEGFERLGKTALDEGVYPNSSMYIDPSRGPVVNPWHQQMVPDPANPGKQKRAGILFHRASVPSDLLGCVGIGWIYAGKLTDSREALNTIFALAGGSAQHPHPVLTVKVVGARTPYSADANVFLKGLTPYAGL